VRGSSKNRSGPGGTYPSKPGGRSFNNLDVDEDARLTSVKMGSMAKVEAGSVRSGVSGESEETRDGVRVQTEVLQYHEGPGDKRGAGMV
jgi:hypothetical protein